MTQVSGFQDVELGQCWLRAEEDIFTVNEKRGEQME